VDARGVEGPAPASLLEAVRKGRADLLIAGLGVWTDGATESLAGRLIQSSRFPVLTCRTSGV
jgi:hypothetical protein